MPKRPPPEGWANTTPKRSSGDQEIANGEPDAAGFSAAWRKGGGAAKAEVSGDLSTPGGLSHIGHVPVFGGCSEVGTMTLFTAWEGQSQTHSWDNFSGSSRPTSGRPMATAGCGCAGRARYPQESQDSTAGDEEVQRSGRNPQAQKVGQHRTAGPQV